MRWSICLAALVLAGPVSAEPSAQQWERFETCVAESFASEGDNPMAGLGIPVICGSNHVPIPQTCSTIARITSPKSCQERDRDYWRSALEAVLPDGGWEAIPATSMFASGMNRCAQETEEDIARVACETEIYWREVMLNRAGPVIRRVQGQ